MKQLYSKNSNFILFENRHQKKQKQFRNNTNKSKNKTK